jgi:Holliday junction resolvasome RuvABC endonuclease subunit
VLGLDLSLTGLGMVVLDPEGGVEFRETVGVSLKRGAKVKDKIERLTYLAGRVVEVVKSHEPDAVVIEDYAYGARFGATFDLGELGGVVKTSLWTRCRTEPVLVPSSSARKVVLGKGRPKKSEILGMLRERGILFEDHNQADAYVVAEWFRQTRKGEQDE